MYINYLWMYYYFKKIKSEKILFEEDIIVNVYGFFLRYFMVIYFMNMKIY